MNNLSLSHLGVALPYTLFCPEKVLIQAPIDIEKSLRIPLTHELPLPALHI